MHERYQKAKFPPALSHSHTHFSPHFTTFNTSLKKKANPLKFGTNNVFYNHSTKLIYHNKFIRVIPRKTIIHSWGSIFYSIVPIYIIAIHTGVVFLYTIHRCGVTVTQFCSIEAHYVHNTNRALKARQIDRQIDRQMQIMEIE